MSPKPQTDSMKMQELIQALIDQLSLEDIEDGCYEGLPIMAVAPYSGRVYRIIGVETASDIGVHFVLTEA